MIDNSNKYVNYRLYERLKVVIWLDEGSKLGWWRINYDYPMATNNAT